MFIKEFLKGVFKRFRKLKCFGKLKRFGKFNIIKEERGFAMMTFVLLLPIILYSILLALNFAQIYTVQLKMRKALLQAAYAVSKEVKYSTDYADGASENYRKVLLVAQRAFVQALGAKINTVQSAPIMKKLYKLTTSSSENNFISSNISSSQEINTAQIALVAESVLFSKIQIKNAHDFEVKKCYCSVSEHNPEEFDLNKWIFVMYPAAEATGFEVMPYVDIRWLKSKVYNHKISWNCLLEFITSEEASIVNDTGFDTAYSSFSEAQRAYSTNANIRLPYGSNVNLGNLKVSVNEQSGKINIKVSCSFNFLKTDFGGTRQELVNVVRHIVVNTSSSNNVDIAVAVPLHNISVIKGKISKFISRLNIKGIHVSVVPYSSTVVAPMSFKDAGWIKTYKPKTIPIKETNVGGDYSIKFDIHNSYLPNCAKSFEYAKKILDYNSCPVEDKEPCSKHVAIGSELLYYPSVKHYYIRTKNSSYAQGDKEIANNQLFHSTNLVSLENIAIKANIVDSANIGWNNLGGSKYLVINGVKELGNPIAVANAVEYCAMCGAPKVFNVCAVCGSSSFRQMSFFYSCGNLASITDDFKISGDGYDELSVSFDSMFAALDDKSPKGCSLLSKGQSKFMVLPNIYIAVDSSGMHVLATSDPEPVFEGTGGFSHLSHDANNIWYTSGGSGAISPNTNFLNSTYYKYWHVNLLNTTGGGGNFDGNWQSILNVLNSTEFLQNLVNNANVIVFESCNCSEIATTRSIKCDMQFPYRCQNTLLNMANVPDRDGMETVFTTPVHYEIVGNCNAEKEKLSDAELGKACLSGYVKYSIFYKLMDDLGIPQASLVLHTASSSISGKLTVEISRVPVAISYKQVLQKLTEAGIPANSFTVQVNGVADTDYMDPDAKNTATITTVQGGGNIKYPGLLARDLYHSAAKNGQGNRALFIDNIPDTNKIMYPAKDEQNLEYNRILDIGIDGPPNVLLWALNNKPCTGTHGNLTNVGGWDGLISDEEISTDGLFCRTCPEPLDTHSYEMRMLSSNVLGMSFYVALLTDSNERSNFQYLGLVWAARMINYDNFAMYDGAADKVRKIDAAKKVIVFLSTKRSGFFDDELTNLGLLRDDGDALLNNSVKNMALSEEDQKNTGQMLSQMSADVVANIENGIAGCDLYAVSYDNTLDHSIKPLGHGQIYSVSNQADLENILNEIEDRIMMSTGGRITIIE